MRSLTICVVLALCMASAVVVVSDDSDAVPSYGEAYYIFSYDLNLMYTGGTQDIDELVWTIDGYDGDSLVDTVSYTTTQEPFEATVDRHLMERCTDVYITQTIYKNGSSQSETQRLTILGDIADEDSYRVSFFDGYSGSELYAEAFFNTDVIHYGEQFVNVPESPDRQNYDFIGWFYGPDLTQRFDPYAPVTGDVDVYAKWIYTGTSSGDVGSIQIGNHLVTFECSAGLTYTIEDRGSNHVSFSVSAAPGFDVDESTITAHANGTQIHPVDGIHTISGISSDVHVVIAGDLISSDNGSVEGGIPFWVWIVLIIVIVLAIAVVYWMYIRNQRQ